MTAGLDARRDQHVPGAFNVRDAGGYPTATGRLAWSRLYRSAGLQDLDDAGRAALAALGVRTVVDLRSAAERAAAPSALAGTGITVLDRPVHEDGTGLVPRDRLPSLGRLYALMLTRCGAGFVAAVRELARPGALPALVHCAAGKDRTGIVVALVQSALGVPDDVVAADYALTADRLPAAFLDRLPVPEHLDAEALTALHAIYRDSPAEVMRELLTTLRTDHGGAAAYLRANGLTAGELTALATALEEDS